MLWLIPNRNPYLCNRSDYNYILLPALKALAPSIIVVGEQVDDHEIHEYSFHVILIHLKYISEQRFSKP